MMTNVGLDYYFCVGAESPHLDFCDCNDFWRC
nr:MAG TPA: hypothetical protein [Caudoviricetes sp.]